MKIKDIVKLPKFMDCECPPKSECTCDLGLMTGRNDAIQEIGNMEIIMLSEKDLSYIISPLTQLELNYIGGPKAHTPAEFVMAIRDVLERASKAKFPTAKPVNEGHYYQCICCQCGELFIGDKRVVSCPKCSKPPVKEELESERLDRFLITIGLFGMSRPEVSCDVLRKRLVEKLSEQFAVTNKPDGPSEEEIMNIVLDRNGRNKKGAKEIFTALRALWEDTVEDKI